MLAQFLVAWFGLLTQPCLMAAPLVDCHDSGIHQRSTEVPDGAIEQSDVLDGLTHVILAGGKSMAGCTGWFDPEQGIPSFDLEKKFLESAVSSPIADNNPTISIPSPFGRERIIDQVPRFIRNCAFLI